MQACNMYIHIFLLLEWKALDAGNYDDLSIVFGFLALSLGLDIQ